MTTQKTRRIAAYVGQTRSRALIAHLSRLGIGECTNRGELPPRRWPFFLDNGGYKDWRAGASQFDVLRWSRDLAYIGHRLDRGRNGSRRGPPRDASEGWGRAFAPDFIVLPDLVGQGRASLAFSLDHLFYLEPWPELSVRYLAVQDGLTPADIAPFHAHFQGIFIGGTLAWKYDTARAWVRFAHECSIPCHIGRVGTVNRVRWAIRVGADSIDSSLPLWSRTQLDAFVRSLGHGQLSLPFGELDCPRL